MPVADSESASSAPAGVLEASVVVPVYNGQGTLRRCIEAIFASKGIGKFEVIIVDDGSTDGSAEIAACFPCRLIRWEQRQGPAATRNRGAQEARARRLVFVDADVFVRQDTLARLLSALDGAPAAFGSYDPVPLHRNFATELYHTLSCQSIRDTSDRTPVFHSYCGAIWRSLFLEAGGFDTNFTRATFEDIDLGCRLSERSLLSQHLSGVEVVHAVRYDLPGLARAYFRKSRDLASLLLARGRLSLDNQGWTHWRNWAVLVSAWATLALGPLALFVHPLWALPWVLALATFLAASAKVYRQMAHRRGIHGPLVVLAYFGIQFIATVAMLTAALDWLRVRLKAPTCTPGELIAPFAIFFLLYASTLSRVPSANGDSIYYVNAIDSREGLFHPHHLLYNAFAVPWVALWRNLGVGVDSLLIVSTLNAVFGALCLSVFYRLLRRQLQVDSLTALLGTSLPGFSFAMWYYSGSVEVYIIPLFVLLFSFSLLIEDQAGRGTFALVGVLNGIAVLFAQIHVLFGGVVLVAALCRHRRAFWRPFGYYALTAAPTAALHYLLILGAVRKPASLSEAWNWLTRYGNIPSYWHPLSLATPMNSAIGLGRAVIGSHFVFAISWLRTAVERNLPGMHLGDEMYLVRNMSAGVAYLLLALSVALLLILLLAVFWCIRSWPSLPPQTRRAEWLLLCWIGTYAAFVFFYAGFNAKLWITQSVCLWLMILLPLLAATQKTLRRGSRIALAVAAVLLLTINFWGSIRFTRDAANDYYLARTSPLVHESGRNDLIVVGDGWVHTGYLKRLGRPHVASLFAIYTETGGGAQCTQALQRSIEDSLASGNGVVISEEAIRPDRASAQTFGSGLVDCTAIWDTYRRRWSRKEFQKDAVYVLR